MGIGIRLRRLWRMRGGVIVCLGVALLAAVWSVQKISLAPPGMTPRSLEIASASTHVVVDTPKSALVDGRQDTSGLEGLTERAVLLGNVMSSGQVRLDIARAAHVDPELLQIAAPLTRAQPRPLAQSGNEKHTSDIVRSPDEYRLSILANPTVPVLDVYAQAPTAATAAALANGAVDSLRRYLVGLAETEATPETQQIRLVQLGRAKGTVVNQGIRWQVAFVAFVLTFGVACATLIFMARVRDGWRLEAAGERRARARRRDAPNPQEGTAQAR